MHSGLGPYAHGYGVPQRDLADGCDSHEASILYVGNLGANEQSTLALPLPNGLQAVGLKRITATLAWLSPVNWRHRQYRRAALDFAKPKGFTDLGGYLDVDGERSKRADTPTRGMGGEPSRRWRCRQHGRLDRAMQGTGWRPSR